MTVLKSPFESKYGFRGNNFSVDENGNLVANTLTLLEIEDETQETPADYIVSSSPNLTDFVFENFANINPSITVVRGSRFIFELNLGENSLSIYDSDQISLFSSGLQHSDGTSGVTAQDKSSGRLFFTVPASTPDIIYYGNLETNTFGRIDVIDPDGSFDRVNITNVEDSQTSTTGALTVAGGVGIQKNLTVGETLNVTNIFSTGDITFQQNDEIIFLANDSSVLGIINNEGSTIPLNNTTIESTIIGENVPAQANFTSASVTDTPTNDNDITSKRYVDSTVTALTIALGI